MITDKNGRPLITGGGDLLVQADILQMWGQEIEWLGRALQCLRMIAYTCCYIWNTQNAVNFNHKSPDPKTVTYTY